MSETSSLFEKRSIIIFISLIWGLGLSLLFRKICTNDKCVVIKVPHELKSDNNIIRNSNKCYKLKEYPVPCE